MAETLAKKFNVNVLTANAFKSIPKGSGNILSDFSLETPKIDETNVIHATQGGVTITYQNSTEDTLSEIDNMFIEELVKSKRRTFGEET